MSRRPLWQLLPPKWPYCEGTKQAAWIKKRLFREIFLLCWRRILRSELCAVYLSLWGKKFQRHSRTEAQALLTRVKTHVHSTWMLNFLECQSFLEEWSLLIWRHLCDFSRKATHLKDPALITLLWASSHQATCWNRVQTYLVRTSREHSQTCLPNRFSQ